MRIGVLGTGAVGRTLATRMIADGHHVMLGSRSADHPDASAWAVASGPRAGHGTFADACRAADLLVNATPGTVSLVVLASVDPHDLVGVTLLDVANPLDFSQGFPPSLTVCNTDSLGERIQAAHPDLGVVKALNTMHHAVMVEPARLPGAHHVFLCGNDTNAKAEVRALLAAWGWSDGAMVDLGDITAARGVEMLLPLWVRISAAIGTADFNLGIVRAAP